MDGHLLVLQAHDEVAAFFDGVFVIEGQDVGAELVREGWALAYRQFRLDYVGEEREAKAAKAGLWSMDVVEPWEWRRCRR